MLEAWIGRRTRHGFWICGPLSTVGDCRTPSGHLLSKDERTTLGFQWKGRALIYRVARGSIKLKTCTEFWIEYYERWLAQAALHPHAMIFISSDAILANDATGICKRVSDALGVPAINWRGDDEPSCVVPTGYKGHNKGRGTSLTKKLHREATQRASISTMSKREVDRLKASTMLCYGNGSLDS